ncbi:MAG: hypothetical protein IIU96_02290 [Paludibacteraceae bacterium]|nr:hypothetical protein [Paludibacteraceae bacterium]
MKKSFVVFSLIGLVAMGMSLSSCSKETKPTYSYEEGWEMFDTEVAKLNQKYDLLLQDSTPSAETNVEADIKLRCKYKGANSGKLMYSVLKRVFSAEFLAQTEGMSQDELKKSVIAETEKLAGPLDEQLKTQIVQADLDELKKTKLTDQYETISDDFMKYGMKLSVSEMRDYTEEYMKLINTMLTEKEERMILTMQCSMQYYIYAFWHTEGAKL